MEFWYGIVRNVFGKIRSRRISVVDAPTQADFLRLIEFSSAKKDVIVELDCGSHMSQDEFTSYVSLYYQSDKRVISKDMASFTN